MLHSISLPPGEYGGDAIERLFTNRLDWSAHPYFETIRGLTVSSHFLIRRDGALVQFVSCDDRAWHAGASRWRGATNCNDFSIGIELEGLEGAALRGRAVPGRSPALLAQRSRCAIRSPRWRATSTSRRAARTIPAPGFDWAAAAPPGAVREARFRGLIGPLRAEAFRAPPKAGNRRQSIRDKSTG